MRAGCRRLYQALGAGSVRWCFVQEGENDCCVAQWWGQGRAGLMRLHMFLKFSQVALSRGCSSSCLAPSPFGIKPPYSYTGSHTCDSLQASPSLCSLAFSASHRCLS